MGLDERTISVYNTMLHTTSTKLIHGMCICIIGIAVSHDIVNMCLGRILPHQKRRPIDIADWHTTSFSSASARHGNLFSSWSGARLQLGRSRTGKREERGRSHSP